MQTQTKTPYKFQSEELFTKYKNFVKNITDAENNGSFDDNFDSYYKEYESLKTEIKNSNESHKICVKMIKNLEEWFEPFMIEEDDCI